MDRYAAYYNSMFLIQDTTDAIFTHMNKGFSRESSIAYIEIWGVMQAIQIQQDAIVELYSAVVGGAPALNIGPGWIALRDLRNLLAGHPARRTHRIQGTQRAFMGRRFGTYDRLTYELWDSFAASLPQPAGKVFRGTSFPTVNLRQMIIDYADEAAAALQTVYETMQSRWP